MSSISGGRSPRFIPPQSAQPYRSIFGGSSSQDVADLQPYPEWQGDAAFGSDDFDVAMEDIPIVEDDHPDDSTYKESDEDEPGSEAGGSQQRIPQSTADAATGHSDIVSPPSSAEYRPNRFRGSESQWRKLTAEDRQNAEALETIRARDLAAHLYNAYALRVRARELARQAVEAGEPEDEIKVFGPPKRWAAWPMSATEVPRGNEHSRRQLRPLTRNILTQFDDLLMALHNARNGGVGADDSSASHPLEVSQAVNVLTVGMHQVDEHLLGLAHVVNQNHKTQGRGGAQLAATAKDLQVVCVLASATGAKCAALFREDMEFRVLQEGTLQQVRDGGSSTWAYAENEPEEPGTSLPPPSPPPTKRSLSRTTSVKKASSTRATSPATDHTDEVTRGKGKGQHRKQDLICPVRTCPRHINGFARTWNLNLHMKRMHAGYRPKSTDSKSKSSVVGPAGDTDS
ncbi:hypothetical protein AFLA_007096 [Aspergillus flavus NRRL3357]|nr:hypothetical protein AFLA_007096 [Aspergillus flavus NRRL3357]